MSDSPLYQALEMILTELATCSGEWPALAAEVGIPYGTLKRITQRTVNSRIDTLEKLRPYLDRRRFVLTRLQEDRSRWPAIATRCKIPVEELEKIAIGTVRVPGNATLEKIANYFVRPTRAPRMPRLLAGTATVAGDGG